MKFTLRSYQQEAVDIAVRYLKKNSEPALLELATGAGKSIICAEVARIMLEMSNKKILCLCPSAELVKQNFEKFLMTGYEASIYSASIGKSLRHNVVFATEGTFNKVASLYGEQYSTVIIDEAHKITPTIKKIISDMREGNANIRVLGMTATPYRLGTGYIYQIDQYGKIEENAVKPYFKKLLYSIRGDELVDMGFLTEPVIGEIHSENYNTDNVVLKSNGIFDKKTIDEAFLGHGKKTAGIVADVINQSNIRDAKGVMFFAATVDHAKEVLASLPSYNSALITGDTKKADRDRIISEFKEQNIKYLVNVSVLTTGFDAAHVSLIAVLRATESAALYQQIVGRALRLYDGKTEALILDYADNIKRFFPDGDIFNPQIMAYGQKPQIKGEFSCPKCHNPNSFTLRENPDHMEIDNQGYFLSLDNERIEVGKGKFIPAHYGRRCTFIQEMGLNRFERCDHFWDCKMCELCGTDNDIAARRCSGCKALLIDPNDKLIGTFKDFKNDLSMMQTDRVINLYRKETVSIKGNPTIRVTFVTPHRKFLAFFSSKVNRKFYEMLKDPTFNPITVSYKKKNDFFTVSDFNRQEDLPV